MTDLGRMHNMHDRDDLLAEQVCVSVCLSVKTIVAHLQGCFNFILYMVNW